MERTPLENTHDTIDVESARFLDHLEPDQESTWKDLVESLVAAQGGKEALFTGYRNLAPVLKDMWLDPELPAVYRDRAMLELMRRFYVFSDVTGISTSGGWGSEYAEQIVEFTQEEQELRDAWYLEVFTHTLQTGEYILGVTKTYMLAIELFDKGKIDSATLEDTLNRIAITNPGFEEDVVYETPDGTTRSYKKTILPNFARYDTDAYSELQHGRFPVIEDILSGVLTRGSADRAKDWAIQQLDTWLDYKDGAIGTEELPLWLASINDENDGLTIRLFASRRSDIYRTLSFSTNTANPVIPWETYQRAVHLFGWGVLTTEIATFGDRADTQKRVRMRLDYVLDLADQMSTTDFADELLLYFLRTYYEERDSMPEEEKPEIFRDGVPDGLDRALFGSSKTVELIERRLSVLSGPEDSELARYLTRVKQDLIAKNDSRTVHFENQRLVWEQESLERTKERQARDSQREAVAKKLPELLQKLRN